MSLKKVLNVIKKNKKFIISAHVNLEGDALGSELALARLLRQKGKKVVVVVNADRPPEIYNFLPGINSIINAKQKVEDYDVFIALDCCDERRLGKASKFIKKDKIVVNIDHHKSNNNFGDVNWVEANASSASEMVYQIFKKINSKIDKGSALLLYVGIMTDTGSFRYSNTNEGTHRIAAELLRKNLSVNKIYQKIYEVNPLEDMKILTNLLSEFKTDEKKKIAWVKIKSGLMNKLDSRIDIADNIFGFLRSIKGIEASLIFKELNSGLTKINFRSRGKVDVAKFAKRFGGGGHHSASGCTVAKGLKDAERLIINNLKKVI